MTASKTSVVIGSLWLFNDCETIIIINSDHAYYHSVYSWMHFRQEDLAGYHTIAKDQFSRWIATGNMVCLNDGK